MWLGLIPLRAERKLIVVEKLLAPTLDEVTQCGALLSLFAKDGLKVKAMKFPLVTARVHKLEVRLPIVLKGLVIVRVGSPFPVLPGAHTLVVRATLQWPMKAIPRRLIPLSRPKAPLYLRANPRPLPITPPGFLRCVPMAPHAARVALRVTVAIFFIVTNFAKVNASTNPDPNPTVVLSTHNKKSPNPPVPVHTQHR